MFAPPQMGGEGGKAFRMPCAEPPRAVAAHAQAGKINAICVHGVGVLDAVEQLEQRFVVPDFAFGTLRRDDDEREVRALFHEAHRAVDGNAVDVRARSPAPWRNSISGLFCRRICCNPAGGRAGISVRPRGCFSNQAWRR